MVATYFCAVGVIVVLIVVLIAKSWKLDKVEDQAAAAKRDAAQTRTGFRYLAEAHATLEERLAAAAHDRDSAHKLLHAILGDEANAAFLTGARGHRQILDAFREPVAR